MQRDGKMCKVGEECRAMLLENGSGAFQEGSG